MWAIQIVRFKCFFLVLVAFEIGTHGSIFAQGPIAATIQQGSIRIGLNEIASNMVAPNLATHAGDGSGRLFVVDQAGEVGLIKNGMLSATPYLDTSSLLVPLGGIIPPFQDPFGDFDERGLLGLAFHPGFSSTGSSGFGKVYSYTSEPVAGTADFTVALPAGETMNHQSVVREWTVDPTLDVVTGVASRIVMTIDEPQFNHDAGMLAFGQDQQLYISLGDGGGGGDDDSGHATTGNGQDPTNVLGSILRIDPLGNNSANGQYGIPANNPFVGGAAGIVEEIFAFGLRNPFRFSFDNGQLIVADVGQSNIEEVNVVNSGDNLGWRLKEGSFFYDNVTNAVSDTPFGTLPAGFIPIDPAMEYDHDDGISVIGGFVYRGTAIPELVGKYVFGDFSNAGFFTPGGRLFYGDLTTGEILEFQLAGGDLGLYVKGFGQDENGELYLLGGTNLGPFRGANGQGFGGVFQLVAVPEPDTAIFSLLIFGVVALQRKRNASATYAH